MNGVSPRRRPRVPLPTIPEEPEGYAWNYYGRDTLPDEIDPQPVRPPSRRQRRRRDDDRHER